MSDPEGPLIINFANKIIMLILFVSLVGIVIYRYLSHVRTTLGYILSYLITIPFVTLGLRELNLRLHMLEFINPYSMKINYVYGNY